MSVHLAAMPRRCLACSSPRAGAINERLWTADRPPLHRIAVEFGLSNDALERHAKHHLTDREPTGESWPDQGDHAECGLGDHPAPHVPDPDDGQPRMNRSARAGQRRATKPDLKQRFLDAYAQTGNVSQSAREAGIGRKTVYSWQEQDETFVLAMREAENQAIELLEAEARTRATTGSRLVREVYRGDRLVERIVEYRPSDAVLVKLLQALRPDKYGDKLAVTQTQIVKTMDNAAWDAV
jgi:hypothetical protein